MSEKTYSLTFHGYCRAYQLLPPRPGIYCVYAGILPVPQKELAIGIPNWIPTFRPTRLLDIGESENVRKRIEQHDRRDKWKAALHQDEVVGFSMADVTPASDRKRAEAAMILANFPLCSSQQAYLFRYGRTTIVTSGETCCLKERFTVPGPCDWRIDEPPDLRC